MATLLMIESWLRSTGICLPPIIRDMGHEYVLLTRDPSIYAPLDGDRPHPVVENAAEIVVADTNDLDAVRHAARTVDQRLRVDGALTTCDYYLEAAAAAANDLGLPGAPAEVMRTATQKHRVRAALAAAGLPNPAFAAVDSWQDARGAAARLGLPLIGKPVDLNAGTAVELIESEGALKDAFWHVAGIERNTRGQPLQRLLLLEEPLKGQEVSVEAVTYEGTTSVIGITDKSVTAAPARVESGHMFPARLDPSRAREIEALVADALAAIGYTYGLSHTEVALTADGPRIIEINPRQGGGYIFDLVHLVAGVHPLDMLVDLALGRMPDLAAAASAADGTAGSAAVFFVMSPRDGVVEYVAGSDRLQTDPRVWRWSMLRSGPVRRPQDNDAYLGHVLTVDPDGRRARAYAEQAVRGLELHFDDGATASPLGIPSGLA
ncbi:ATP-grasp domain-containing protein [Actinobacteria bacterium YIM 96077]|uniref:Carboxylate--amine ligase n=1 Tax=Phytoactinopolyspora halophila TaxID=1981511 RepID=A0A329QPD2_9ACTN|nr:ATP-grasp domain-containing protein [Phytoactinopolyspora halophila]AYY14597.1 ATP-grasp domain-containing protein [Actinobacteria bacterium YIM 96077]RAW14026.1 carboxylate--amine ligase [Phytoactinopolyspora halophila]